MEVSNKPERHTTPFSLRSSIATALIQRQAEDPAESKPTEVRFGIKDLDFFYASQQVLKKISLDIPANRITALIGPSGCGKSTFLRVLNRMNDFIDTSRHTGKVLLDGKDIYESGTDVMDLRKRVGMVFQKPNPFPMSIYENIAYGPRTHGLRKKRDLTEIVETTLKAVNLWDEVKDKLKDSAYQLSGGQQQRLCIARVLAVGPEVLLLDEPCSALDPISTLKIEELLAQLYSHYTIVMVTHNLQQAARASHQTGFFLRGELKEVGPTEEMFTSPKEEETEAYITGRFG